MGQVNSNGQKRRGFCIHFVDTVAEVNGYFTWADIKSNNMLSAECCDVKRFGLYHTSKYDSGLLFGLDLVVAFVDLTITFEQTY